MACLQKKRQPVGFAQRYPGCSQEPFSLEAVQNSEFREGQTVLTSLSRSG